MKKSPGIGQGFFVVAMEKEATPRR